MTDKIRSFYELLRNRFPFQPTLLQDAFFAQFAQFVFKVGAKDLYVLKGYAGTGKTSLISLLVNNLHVVNFNTVLLAPTGRAAKVLSAYSGKDASTIHRKIYVSKSLKQGGVHFSLKKNKHTNTLFFVDEASMLSDTHDFTYNGRDSSLLEDLMQYVYNEKNCKLVLIGDTAQLPPVQSAISTALNVEVLQYKFDKKVLETELTEVMRQEKLSGILHNATLLREQIAQKASSKFVFEISYPDVIRLSDGYDIENTIHQSYDNWSPEDTAIIVRSNKRANEYNRQIRYRILGRESDLSAGDYIMVVKNNYYWLETGSDAAFIANGDTLEILEIYQRQELYGFHFARVKVRMIDYPNQPPVEVVLLLDTLDINTASLGNDASQRLYREVYKDYQHLNSKYKIYQSIKSNPYYNALQVKFAYAVTCHKAQGGQWKHVYIEKPWLPEGENIDYWRWLYTAITRSQEKLYLIGFQDMDFEE